MPHPIAGLALLKTRTCPECRRAPMRLDVHFLPDGSVNYDAHCDACQAHVHAEVPAPRRAAEPD